ncbi:MAG: copper oxidase, partial [Propionibacterium sp.]|nr:copper oxidase [Propionibacterium sp.]
MSTLPPPSPKPPTTPRRKRGFRPLVDLPVLIWLAAAVMVALIHPLVPAPRWLMLHLVLLGAISNAIVVWSNHFTHALLHVADEDRRGEQVRLSLLNAGVVAVVGGVLSEIWLITLLGATAVAVAVGWHGWTLVRLLRTTLPARFGRSVRYYIAAACFLPVGAVFGVLL